MLRVAILSALLFLSGISALIFETLWLRLSGLAFGNSVWSAALILSSFMAGLALGNAVATGFKLGRRRPLQVYALLELAVALFGCTIVFGLPHLGEWMRPVFQGLLGSDVILNGIRLFLSFVILLVPTTAMGLTLPILLDDPFLRRHDFGNVIGLLYGANTLGAVAGALLGEVLLIEAVGLWGTSLVAGMLNCIAATAAWLVARTDRATGTTDSEQPFPSSLKLTHRPPWRLVLLSLATGGILLCLEVVWFRFLRLYVAASSTDFSVMLAVVLAAIGLGGIAAGALHRRLAQFKQLLPILLMSAAICTALSYLFFPGPALQKTTGAFYLDSWWEIALLSLALMFPVAFLSGILFPVIAARVQSTVGNRMNSAGMTALFNTTGAAIGPLLASFVLLPTLGFQMSLILCAAAYGALAVVASEPSTWSFKKPFGIAMFGVTAAVVIIAVFAYHRDEKHLANARGPFERDGEYLVKKIEGTADTLQLLRADLYGEPYYYRLMTNSFSMSATTPAGHRYMRLFAYLPLALRPESQDALLICFGLGATADALVRDSQLKHIDIVDISKEVFELADYRSGTDYANPLRDSRVKTFIQDGRFFLQAVSRQYDVITGEPPPPKVMGSVNLYTEEFFLLMRGRLKEGGIVSFWLPIYQLKLNEVKAILRAFQNVFPNASVWAGPDEDWIMIGIKGPGRRLDESEMARLWNSPSTRTDLMRIGIEVPEQLPSLFLMDSGEIDRITLGVKPLTDFYPKRLSDAPVRAQELQDFARGYMDGPAAVRRFISSSLMERIFPDRIRKSAEPFFLVREDRFVSRIERPNLFAQLDLYLRRSRLRVPVLETLGSDEFRLSIAERLPVDSQQPRPPEVIPDLIAGALARRDFTDAIRLLETHIESGKADRNHLLLLTYLYCLSGNVEKAEALASANAGSIQKNWLVDWLWGKLQAEFGFRPPN